MNALGQFPDSFTKDAVLLLNAAGIDTVQQLVETDREQLAQKLRTSARNHGKTLADHLSSKVDAPKKLPTDIGLFLDQVVSEARKLLGQKK